MCGLCGLLGVVHWTEMSANRGVFPAAAAPTIRSERAARTRLVNAVLEPHRIRVSDFQATSYLVASPTGRSEIVDDLQSLWTVVERISGAPVDPLDPGYLDKLSGPAP